MQRLDNAERLALEAFARHLLAMRQTSEQPPHDSVIVAGRRIAIEVAIIESQHIAGTRAAAKARLRDDVVARRVLRDLESALCAHVPDGKTVVLTLAAPIIEPKKLLAALTEILVEYLMSGAEEIEEKKTILGNRVRFQILNGDPRWTAKVIGFVFTNGPKIGILVNAMRSLHDEITARAKKRNRKMSADERWLILVSDHWIADIKTYRRGYSYLRVPGGFNKILMVGESGRIEVLAEGMTSVAKR